MTNPSPATPTAASIEVPDSAIQAALDDATKSDYSAITRKSVGWLLAAAVPHIERAIRDRLLAELDGVVAECELIADEALGVHGWAEDSEPAIRTLQTAIGVRYARGRIRHVFAAGVARGGEATE